MNKVFGNFVEQEDGKEYLIIHFSPSSVPLKQRWRNNGLSADFLAEYWVTFFPADDMGSQRRQQEIKGAINYVANELLENLMKFSYESANYPVSLELYLYQDAFRFYASNAIDPQAISRFQARIVELLEGNTDDLYIQQLEKNVVEGISEDSNLGLLTMMHDYGAQLAWSFEMHQREDSEVPIVTTMVRLAV